MKKLQLRLLPLPPSQPVGGDGSSIIATSGNEIDPSSSYLNIEFTSRIISRVSQDSGEGEVPVFRVFLGNTLIAQAQSPQRAWVDVLYQTHTIVAVLTGKLRRCRAVFNRTCIDPDAFTLLEQVPANTPAGSHFLSIIQAPVWMRDVHSKLKEVYLLYIIYGSEYI